jgi:hypothetical protein
VTQATTIAVIPGVTFKYAQSSNVPLLPGHENVLVVVPEGIRRSRDSGSRVALCVPRPPKPVPDAPPKVETEEKTPEVAEGAGPFEEEKEVKVVVPKGVRR